MWDFYVRDHLEDFLNNEEENVATCTPKERSYEELNQLLEWA